MATAGKWNIYCIFNEFKFAVCVSLCLSHAVIVSKRLAKDHANNAMRYVRHLCGWLSCV